MKKILLNAYIDLNLGDDLFLKILFDRYPEVKWVLPKGGKKYRDIFKDYKNVEIKDDIIFKIKYRLGIKEKNSFFNRYSAGLYIGGSIFMQIDSWKEQLQERKNIIHSFNKKNKPYFILGSNFGPYNEEKFLSEYEYLFKKCKDVCFRDEYSYNTFKNLDNVRIAPDIVFQLKPKLIEKKRNSIGISLINLEGRNELEIYKKNHDLKIKELVKESIEIGKKVTFFSFCEKQGDLKAIEDIVNNLDEKYKEKINIVSYDGDIDYFLTQFESMENIIGERFHACILSQVFNQGLYPIIYSNKTYNVLKDIGLNKYYKYIKDIESLNIKEVLDKISNNKISSNTIFKKAEGQFEVLDKYVKGQ